MANSKKLPSFQFYPADWLADENVTAMTLVEEGAYIRALAYCWREGSIPTDTKTLQKLLKNCRSKTLDVVRSRFVNSEEEPGRLVHPRLVKTKEEYMQFCESQRDRANRRWGKTEDDATALPTQSQGGTSSALPEACSSFLPSSSTSVVSKKERKTNIGSSDPKDTGDTPKPPAGGTPATPQGAAESSDNAKRLAGLLLGKQFLEHTEDQVSDALFARTVDDARRVLGAYSYAEAKSALAFARKDKWWMERFKEAKFPMAFLAKNIDKMLQQVATVAPQSKASITERQKEMRDTTTDPFAKWRKNDDSSTK
jgi:hypothetical protein